ncbi:hypothetical protein Tco_0434526 [Tanacetum coccineum]
MATIQITAMDSFTQRTDTTAKSTWHELKTLNVLLDVALIPEKTYLFVVSDTEYGCALYESVVRLCMRLLWLTVNRNNAMYCASVEDIVVQYCFFDILLTSLSPRNYIPLEVLLRVSMHSACSTSENALEKPLDIRKLDNSSYQALGACFKPYKAFLKRLERTCMQHRQRKSELLPNEQLEQMILRNQYPLPEHSL